MQEPLRSHKAQGLEGAEVRLQKEGLRLPRLYHRIGRSIRRGGRHPSKDRITQDYPNAEKAGRRGE